MIIPNLFIMCSVLAVLSLIGLAILMIIEEIVNHDH